MFSYFPFLFLVYFQLFTVVKEVEKLVSKHYTFSVGVPYFRGGVVWGIRIIRLTIMEYYYI